MTDRFVYLATAVIKQVPPSVGIFTVRNVMARRHESTVALQKKNQNKI